jgi:RNA polymerase sigma-70 factor, ECF subfamily
MPAATRRTPVPPEPIWTAGGRIGNRTADERDKGQVEARQPDDLVERMQRGDLDAFEELFTTYKRPVYATALAITRDPFLAEEVLQDCFVKAYRVRERLDPARSPLPWLQRVAINLCYSRVSRRKSIAEPITSLITNLVVDLAARPDQIVESREVLDVLQRGIDALPPKQQTAIILYYLHGYSLAEAAEIANCNVGTMKSRLHYALKALRARLPVERRVPITGTPAAVRVPNR